MEKEIDTWGTDEIVCPYCGYKYNCSYELLHGNRDCGDEKCEECGQTFRWSADFEITYTTEKK